MLRDFGPRQGTRAARAVEIIGRQSGNLIRLVDDLLDIDRISQGKIVLQIAPDRHAQSRRASRRNLPAAADEPRASSFDRTDTGGAVPVRGDAVRSSQVS